MEYKMKKKLSKRVLLYLTNAIFFIVLIGAYFIFLASEDIFRRNIPDIIFEVFVILFKYLLIQCAFTLFSLIVYYLSIMADALNKKYKEQEKDNQDKK